MSKPKLYVRFERGRDGVIGPTYGPYDFVQGTYDLLRVSPDGNELAVYRDGDWHLVDAERAETIFSDYIIYAEEAS